MIFEPGASENVTRPTDFHDKKTFTNSENKQINSEMFIKAVKFYLVFGVVLTRLCNF